MILTYRVGNLLILQIPSTTSTSLSPQHFVELHVPHSVGVHQCGITQDPESLGRDAKGILNKPSPSGNPVVGNLEWFPLASDNEDEALFIQVYLTSQKLKFVISEMPQKGIQCWTRY